MNRYYKFKVIFNDWDGYGEINDANEICEVESIENILFENGPTPEDRTQDCEDYFYIRCGLTEDEVAAAKRKIMLPNYMDTAIDGHINFVKYYFSKEEQRNA